MISEHSNPSSTAPGDIFATTHWTVVLAAGRHSTPQSDDALEELCRTYWFPLYAYVRRRGYTKEDAESWREASEGFRAIATLDEWVVKGNSIRKPLGKLLSRKVEKTELEGSFIVAKFDSSFEALKTASETATFVLETNGQRRAVGYLIAPRSVTNNAAIEPAQAWLRDVDNGNYAQSWTNAAALFQSAVTPEKLAEALQQVRKPLGSLISRKVKSAQETTSLPGVPDGRYIVMQFETAFANKKSAVETVTFMLEKDGQWRPARYFIK